MSAPLRVRPAVRALLVTPEREVLLLCTRHGGASGGLFWLAPGGGVEPGESPREALARELREELGFVLRAEAPSVHTRSFEYVSRTYGPTLQEETYFLVRTPRFEPSFEQLPSPDERAAIEGHAWWTADAIEAEPSHVRFAPPGIPAILRRVA